LPRRSAAKLKRHLQVPFVFQQWAVVKVMDLEIKKASKHQCLKAF
jgi:hypothetical protein